MKISDQLTDLRSKKGLTQEAVAEALNVSRQAISRWELGDSIPSLENLVQLCRLYGVSLDDLVNNVATIPEPQSSEKDPPSPKPRWGLIALFIILALLVGAMIGIQLSQEEGSADDPISIDDLQIDRSPPSPESTFHITWEE